MKGDIVFKLVEELDANILEMQSVPRVASLAILKVKKDLKIWYVAGDAVSPMSKQTMKLKFGTGRLLFLTSQYGTAYRVACK